jgi:hypothetical protein
MKNKIKILSVVFAVAMAVAAAWNFSQNQDEVALSDLALENVEALANGEVSAGKAYVHCQGSDIICTGNGNLRCCV